jgi:flagellin
MRCTNRNSEHFQVPSIFFFCPELDFNFDVASSELDARSENLAAAESVIRDSDIAAETASLTQYQILQQAGATVLAQANSAPQIALTLLQSL